MECNAKQSKDIVICHALACFSLVFPFAGVFAVSVFKSMKKGLCPPLQNECNKSLNFQLTFAIICSFFLILSFLAGAAYAFMGYYFKNPGILSQFYAVYIMSMFIFISANLYWLFMVGLNTYRASQSQNTLYPFTYKFLSVDE